MHNRNLKNNNILHNNINDNK